MATKREHTHTQKNNIFFVNHFTVMCMHTRSEQQRIIKHHYTKQLCIHSLPIIFHKCLDGEKRPNDLHMLLLSSSFGGLHIDDLLVGRRAYGLNELFFINMVEHVEHSLTILIVKGKRAAATTTTTIFSLCNEPLIKVKDRSLFKLSMMMNFAYSTIILRQRQGMSTCDKHTNESCCCVDSDVLNKNRRRKMRDVVDEEEKIRKKKEKSVPVHD